MSEVVTLSEESVDMVARRVIELQGERASTLVPKLLSSDAVMALLGYDDKANFFTAARASGCPMVKVNARKILFDEADVAAWIERRKGVHHSVRVTYGKPAPRRRRVSE